MYAGSGPAVFALRTELALAAGWLLVCGVFWAAASWGFVLPGWRRLVLDPDDRAPVVGVGMLLLGTAVIAASVMNVVGVLQTGKPYQ